MPRLAKPRFSRRGVLRLLDNVFKSLTATSLMSLSATVLMGIVGAIVWFVGSRQIFAGTLTLGQLMTFMAFLAFLIAPVIQVVSIGTQLTEALAGLDRTREVLSERPEDQGTQPDSGNRTDSRRGRVRKCGVLLRRRQAGSVRRELPIRAGHRDGSCGTVGVREIDHHQPGAAFHTPTSGVITVDDVDLSTVRLDTYRTQFGVVLQDTFLFDGID